MSLLYKTWMCIPPYLFACTFCLQSDDSEDGPVPAGYQWLIEDDEVDVINVVGAGAHQDAAVYCADADLMEQQAKKAEWYIQRVDHGVKFGR